MIRVLFSILALMLISSCDRSRSRQGKPVEIETVEVGSDYDAGLSTEADQRARKIEVDLGGVLPSDFPEGLPVFSPSSIVDFGPGFVEVDTPVPQAEVRSSISSQIERSGWTATAGDADGGTYTLGGRRVRIRLSAIGSGTRIRYEY